MRNLMVGLAVALASCASGDKDGGTEGFEDELASEADILLDDGEDGGGVDGGGMDGGGADDVGDQAMESMESLESLEESGGDDGDDGDGAAAPAGAQAPGEPALAEYTVKKGDTLMWVAFRLYGDYARWRSFLGWNPGLAAGAELEEGRVLRYEPPAEPFVWNPRGEPHLIVRGETLGSISMDKYKTTKRWRDLYENNRPMIKDPDLIFAGFTLHYVPLRELASE